MRSAIALLHLKLDQHILNCIVLSDKYFMVSTIIVPKVRVGLSKALTTDLIHPFGSNYGAFKKMFYNIQQ